MPNHMVDMKKYTVNATTTTFGGRYREVYRNVSFLHAWNRRYLPLAQVLEMVQYRVFSQNRDRLVVTDGTILLTIPRSSRIGLKGNTALRVDPLFRYRGTDYISLRTINRLFNVDVRVNAAMDAISIRQPGRLFITMRGDTIEKISRLHNTTVASLMSINPNLMEPISPNMRVRIPSIPFVPAAAAVNTNVNANAASKDLTITLSQSVATRIANLGLSLRGTPYVLGAGPYPESGAFDCCKKACYFSASSFTWLP